MLTGNLLAAQSRLARCHYRKLNELLEKLPEFLQLRFEELRLFTEAVTFAPDAPFGCVNTVMHP